MKLTRGLMVGALGGIAGAAAQGVMMLAARKFGWTEKTLPEHVEAKLEEKMGIAHKTSDDQTKALAVVQHFLLGAAYGAGYGALRSQRAGKNPLLSGSMLGLGVYARDIVAVGPSLGLTQPPWETSAETNTRRVLNHLIFGLVTSLVIEKVLENS